MSRCYGAIALILMSPLAASAADVKPLLAKLRAVGPEGAGNTEAAAAWQQLSKLGPDAILPSLAGLDGASPIAANWIRSAIEAQIAKAIAKKATPPAKELAAFLEDTKHSAIGRRMVYELLTRNDPKAAERWLPKFLNDPALELRFDAVAAALGDAKKLAKDDPTAKKRLTDLLNAARALDQIEAIAKELEDRGETLDRVAHYGFLTRWYLIASFDNKGGKGFAAVFPPERAFASQDKHKGKGDAEVTWKAHTTSDKFGIVDFNKAFSPEKEVVAYAYTVVESPTEQQVEIRAGSITAIKMWLNGKEVFARETYHQGMEQDSHAAPCKLQKGRNTVLLKICQNAKTLPWEKDWQFQVRFTDSLGAGIPVTIVDPAPEANNKKENK